MPHYDFNTCPFYVVRDKTSVSVINVKREQIVVVVNPCPLSIDSVERTFFFDIDATDEDKVYSLYNLEFEKKERDRPGS